MVNSIGLVTNCIRRLVVAGILMMSAIRPKTKKFFVSTLINKGLNFKMNAKQCSLGAWFPRFNLLAC